jgi:hypothetical protein
MASRPDIIFPASMAGFLANLIDICFGSMAVDVIVPVVSSTVGPAPHELIPETAAVAALTQQVGKISLATLVPNMLEKAHPPIRYNLITELDRVSSMMAKTIQICEEALDMRALLRPHPTRCSALGIQSVPTPDKCPTCCRSNLRRSSLLEDHVWFEDRWMVASLCDE